MANLVESLECSVCYFIPQSAPIYQCENGHIVCKACCQLLIACPECQQPLGNIRNLFAEQMLRTYTPPCRFEVHGCSTKALLNEQVLHARECKFREVKCPYSVCRSNNIPICRLVNHTMEQHSFREVPLTDGQVVLNAHVDAAAFLLDGDYASSSKVFIKSKNHHFFLKHHRIHEQGLLFCWVCIDGTPKEAKNFLCKISMFNDATKEKHTFEGHPISIDVPMERIIESKMGLVFTDITAKRLLALLVEHQFFLNFKIKVKDLN